MANLQELIPAFFVGPNGERLTPEQIAQRQQVAQSLLGRATDTRPDAGGWASVLTKGLLGYQSGAGQRAADAAIKANAEQSQNDIAALLNGGAGFPSAVAQGASPTSGVATGTSLPPQLTPLAEGSEWLQYANQGATRNLPINEKLSSALSFLPEMGVTMRVISGGQVGKGEKGSRVGSTRHDHGNAADVDFFIGDRKLTPKNPEDLSILSQIVQRGKAAGITGWGEGDDYMGSGRVHLGFGSPGVWGAGGKSANAPEWLTSAYNTPYTPQQAIQAIAPIEQADSPYPEEGQVATHDFTGNPQLSSAAGVPMQNIPSEQFDARFNGQASAPMTPSPEVANALVGGSQNYAPGQVVTGPDGQTYQNIQQIDGSYALSRYNPNANQPSESLLAQNDMMLGGALSPSGSSPVAQALSGYFPDAPGASQQSGNNMTANIARILGSPYSSNEAKQVALGMYQQQQAQAKAALEQQRMLAQRQATAGALGINPSLAGADEAGWKAAIDQATRNRNTVTVGNTVYDANTGQPIIQGASERFRTITGQQAQQLGLDPKKAYNVGPDGKISSIGDNGVTVNVGGGEKFDEEFAKLDAKSLADVSTSGMQAQRNIARIGQLERLLQSAPSGFGALAAQRAGEWGINTEGLDSIQAAQAVINSLVPEQRPAGSGPMSDADLELFKQSLPRIINTPSGNQTIINTMRGIAQYDAEGANIVQRYRTGEITRAKAFEELRNRKNPLANFKASPAPTQQSGNGWRDIGNGVKIRAKQ